MRWMDVKPLSKMSAGHKQDGHKNCQKCLQVMRWMKTNCQKCAGHELDKHTVKCVCRSWDRWTQTLSKVSEVMRWMDTNTVKSVCRSWDGWTQTLSKVSARHEMDEHKHCQKCLRSWDGWTQTLSKVSEVMRWMDTNTVKSVWGHEMDGHKHC